MTKQKYPHFDPSKHNVDVKMAKVRVSSHEELKGQLKIGDFFG